MRTYLNEHDSQSAYENFLSTREDEDFPRVDYIKSTKEVIYNSMPYDYSKDYLTFKALEDGTFTLTIPSQVDTNYLTSVSYSTDNGSTWVTTQNDATEKVITTPSITTGNTILWKGSGISTSITGDTPYVSKFSSTGAFDIEGNIMSMLYGDNFANQTTLPSNSTNFRNLFNGSDIVDASNLKLPATTLTVDCYRQMFKDCTSLTTTPELPATTLAESCYYQMFRGCTSLTSAPRLPATTLVDSCYRTMFYGCTSLITAPIISATTVGSYGCYGMFYNCTSLTTAPELPATTVGPNCYEFMFYQCSSLVNLPSTLPTTTLADNCYKQMFDRCSALTSIPSGLLPATTLAPNCYKWMFENCTSLNNVPSTLLPATTLVDSCYQSMFYNCTSLTTAPDLPATTLANGCYNCMFYNCTSLTTAPELPATTLTYYCYQYMFYGCTALTTAPELPATTLTYACYSFMFQNCSNLNYIKAMFTTEPSTSYTRDWVQGVAATGTFVKNSAATWDVTSTVTGTYGVPSGWFIVFWDTNYDYFTTEAIDDSVFTFSIPSGIQTSTLNYVEYSVDNGQTWIKTNNVDSTAVTVTTPTIMAGNSVKWRCAARAISTSSDHSTFSSSGRYNVSGNVMSLVGCTSEFSSGNALRRLFYNSTNLISAINLSLATTVASECYKQMFSGCTSLIAAPELPATTLAESCYQYMFYGCTALTTAPTLPATTLTYYCYQYMFYGCTALTTAPELPATTLTYACYSFMFQNCSNLNYIKAMFTTEPSTSYTRDWVSGVASTGTFVKNSSATWNVTGIYGIPTGWTVETAAE